MQQKEIIIALIELLSQKRLICGSHIFHGGKAVQIKTVDNGYYNLCLRKLDKQSSFIAKKLK